jgi:hypothetical protein
MNVSLRDYNDDAFYLSAFESGGIYKFSFSPIPDMEWQGVG